MAEEVKMEPVDMTPVAAEPPPNANPLAKPTVTATLKPGLRLPPKPGATVTGLKPGVKLPPKPGATVTALKPGLKLPPKPGATISSLRPGLKLPPKPGATVTTLKPGLKLPPKPGATAAALKPGLKLPPKPGATVPGLKPVIRKPGDAISAHSLPKPVAAPTDSPAVVAAPAAAAPAPKPEEVKPPVVEKPVSIDMQGVGKLPTVEVQAMSHEAVASPVVNDIPKPLDQLKSVTQKLKGITQNIPQQAILHKTGIIAEGAISGAQKEAAKHKTARISLSEAIGVAPVKSDATPMKTIRIKRPIDIPNATKPLAPIAKPASAPAEAPTEATETAVTPVKPDQTASSPTPTSTQSNSTITQRKTLKIARPGGAVRPSGKFGIKRPAATITQASTVVKKSGAEGEAPAEGEISPVVADIADIPPMPLPNVPAVAPVSNGPTWLWSLSSLVQAAACVAIGALAYFLYENVNTLYF